MQESLPLEVVLSPEFRKENTPLLFRFRYPATVDTFKNSFLKESTNARNYPVLNLFLKEEPQLRCLKYSFYLLVLNLLDISLMFSIGIRCYINDMIREKIEMKLEILSSMIFSESFHKTKEQPFTGSIYSTKYPKHGIWQPDLLTKRCIKLPF